ncbi:MAG TPA: Rrf2 family transcriptional regulator, partial [Brevundimonas diminuta]|nr:Rrf2 family transcriptional regulator [Brevundimonas diminuta]HRL24189.1 Rrf2 family transcriptional regulator [Brevundimonas diminuta]
MRLTRYTDYAMRVLLYLGARQDRLCSIAEIAQAYGISQNHLMKVVSDLVSAGYLVSVRGRFGGVRLARPPDQINVGAVVRHTEDGFDLVDCGSCIIAPACGLTGALHQALAAFMKVLDGYTLEGLLSRR